MKGIQFLVDEHGNRKSVLIDLEVWGELWEDIYDNIVAHSALGEPTLTWEDMKVEKDAELERERKLISAEHIQHRRDVYRSL